MPIQMPREGPPSPTGREDPHHSPSPHPNPEPSPAPSPAPTPVSDPDHPPSDPPHVFVSGGGGLLHTSPSAAAAAAHAARCAKEEVEVRYLRFLLKQRHKFVLCKAELIVQILLTIDVLFFAQAAWYGEVGMCARWGGEGLQGLPQQRGVSHNDQLGGGGGNSCFFLISFWKIFEDDNVKISFGGLSVGFR